MVADDHEQLDGVPQFFGEFEIPAGDVFNAADVNFVRGDGGAVGQGGQNEGLVGGVPAVDVQGGVFLRKSQFLGLHQGVLVVGPVFPHRGKNVVGSSVDDPHDGIDVVADQGILEALDDGDAPPGGSLKVDGRAHLRGKLENLRAVFGQQGLVAGHHGLARAEGRRHQVIGLPGAPDQFDDDVYFRVPHQLVPVVGQQFVRTGGIPVLAQVAHGNALDPERDLAPRFQQGVVAAQRLINAGTDRTQSGQAKLYGFFRHSCRAIMQKNPCDARAFTARERLFFRELPGERGRPPHSGRAPVLYRSRMERTEGLPPGAGKSWRNPPAVLWFRSFPFRD